MIPRLTCTALAVQIRTRKNLKPDVPYVLNPRHRKNGLANPAIVSGTTTTTNSSLGKSLETLEPSSVLGLLPGCFVVSLFPPVSFFIYYHESDSLKLALEGYLRDFSLSALTWYTVLRMLISDCMRW